MRSRLTYRAGCRLVLAASLAAILLCSSVVIADDCKRVPNIIVLFDASGFMRDKDRYENLLRQMEIFSQAIPLTADGFFDVGIRHYGLKVGLGCENTESILGIQPWDPERFMNSFPKIISYGVSSLSAGLRGAADDAAGATGKTAILLIGGGLESCPTDPLKTTQQICANNPDLEIHTFQIGGAQDGSFYMRGIAELGRGVYTSLDEGSSQAMWYAWMKKHLLKQCAAPAPTQSAPSPLMFNPIVFDPNSIVIRSKNPAVAASNVSTLETIGKFLKENPGTRLILHGYSEGKGKTQQNLRTARKRAEAVARLLTSSYHVPPLQLSIVAHGGPGEKTGNTVDFEVAR